MASLQQKADGWYCQFVYLRKRHTFTIGRVGEDEAHHWKARTEQLLMRVKQGLLDIPPGVSIADFILHDGKPPVDREIAEHKQTTLHELREAYLETHSAAIEGNTLYTAKIHLNHIEATLGKRFVLSGLTLRRLQDHITRRQASPVTIKKEIDTFRSAWNWAMRMKWVEHPFPARGLVYPKTEEKLPFMTWSEIERRIAAGGDPDILWECLYLDKKQIAALLAFVQRQDVRSWIYPMIVAAAHTGARRSELIRARCEDVDLAQGIITLREKKRARGICTSRRVPISTTLAEALQPLLKNMQFLFGAGDRPLSVQATQKAFVRVLQRSKWDKVRGWHVLRHSFCSALASKGVDQRIIDEFLGHQTEQQRRRYRHLFPSVTQSAIAQVFG